MPRSRLLTIADIHKITKYFHLDCAENWLQKSFNPPQRVRVKRLTYNRSVTKPVNIIDCKWWFSCICIRHTSYLSWILV